MHTSESRVTDYFAQSAKLDPKDFPIGIGDDMAWMNFPQGSALITTDMLLEGTHFDLSSCSLEQVGYKAMAVSLSDCAAMASLPFAAVAAVALPKGFGSQELKELHKGIIRAGKAFGCALVGGDITSWSDNNSKLAVNITMLSKPAIAEPIQRSTAKVGDVICVTGFLGGSLAGRHLDFVPRVKEAIRLTEIAKINSMMDISDGISTDLTHLCRLSCVGARLFAKDIPISQAAMHNENPLISALCDGEDFELLFTLSAEQFEILAAKWNLDVPIKSVGIITDSSDIAIEYEDGKVEQLKPKGYDHIRGH